MAFQGLSVHGTLKKFLSSDPQGEAEEETVWRQGVWMPLCLEGT